MTLFWLILVLLTILAILFTVTPLLWTSESNQVSVQRKDLNIKISKQQLAELEQDLVNGLIDQAQYDSAKTDLERSLLQDIELSPAQNIQTSKKPVFTIAALAIALPLTAALIYWKTGSPQLATYDPATALQQQQQHPNQQPPQHSQNPTAEDFDQMISGLVAKLQQDPDNVEGWLMLAKSYQVMQRLEEASYAYGQVLRLQPENTRALVSSADIMAMTQGGAVAGEPYEMIKKALKLNPAMVEARWLAGIAETELGNLDNALSFWVPLQQELAQTRPELATELGNQINAAKTHLAGSAPVATSTDTNTAQQTTNDAPKSLTVNITLSERLLQLVSPDDTVFIYAKAMQGPGMPLAAKKVKVSDLPITITLDDSMAMMPQMSLSSFDLVKIGARVSKSGQASAMAGDLSGEQIDIKPGQEGQVNIVINTVL